MAKSKQHNENAVNVRIRAQVQLKGKLQGKRLTQPEIFEATLKYPERLSTLARDVFPVAESEVKMRFIQVAVKRLKEDLNFKRAIGGTQWVVEIISMSTEYLGETYYFDMDSRDILVQRNSGLVPIDTRYADQA